MWSNSYSSMAFKILFTLALAYWLVFLLTSPLPKHHVPFPFEILILPVTLAHLLKSIHAIPFPQKALPDLFLVLELLFILHCSVPDLPLWSAFPFHSLSGKWTLLTSQIAPRAVHLFHLCGTFTILGDFGTCLIPWLIVTLSGKNHTLGCLSDP